MGVIVEDSLVETLNRLDDALLFDGELPLERRLRVARWIAARQGMPGAYRGTLFAPTERDFANGGGVYTGEKVRSGAGLACKFGLEAARSLIRLGVEDPLVNDALVRASDGMIRNLGGSQVSPPLGMYCCGSCSVAMWRLLAAGGLNHRRRRLEAGIALLHSRRDGKGRWRSFPFYYTLMALGEMDHQARPAMAISEIRYAAATCIKCLRRLPKDDPLSKRRREVLQRALAKC